jgi:hypothetical protein
MQLTLDPDLDQVSDGDAACLVTYYPSMEICGLPDTDLSTVRCPRGHLERKPFCTTHQLMLDAGQIECLPCHQLGSRAYVRRV